MLRGAIPEAVIDAGDIQWRPSKTYGWNPDSPDLSLPSHSRTETCNPGFGPQHLVYAFLYFFNTQVATSIRLHKSLLLFHHFVWWSSHITSARSTKRNPSPFTVMLTLDMQRLTPCSANRAILYQVDRKRDALYITERFMLFYWLVRDLDIQVNCVPLWICTRRNIFSSFVRRPFCLRVLK